MKWCFIIAILLFVPLVCAENITINYDDDVNSGENFEISLSLIDFAEDNYDVKIDLLNEDEKRICKIDNNGEMQSTYYFLNEIIKPGESKNFELECSEKADGIISVKIRNSKEKSWSFGPDNIEILEGEKTESDEEIKDLEVVEKEENSEKGDIVKEEIIETIEEFQKNSSPIKLEAKNIKTEKVSQNNTERYAKYGLVIFSFLLIILFLLKTKTKEKNEFR